MNRKISFAIWSSALFLIGIASGKSANFLILHDGSILYEEMHNADPDSVDAEYWEIHFYSKSGVRHGGVLTSKTYDALMREVKVMQKCDLYYAKGAKVDIESFDNYQHPGAPIAVLRKRELPKSTLEIAADIYDKISDLNERYKDAKDAWNTFTGNWDKVEVSESREVDNVGKVVEEYCKNFRDVFEKMMKLKGYLNNLVDTEGLNRALSEFDGSLSAMKVAGQKAVNVLRGQQRSRLDELVDASPIPEETPSDASSQEDATAGTYAHHYEASDGYGARLITDLNADSELDIRYSGSDRNGGQIGPALVKIPWSSIERFLVAPSTDPHGPADVVICIKHGCTYHFVTKDGRESDLWDTKDVTVSDRNSAKALVLLLHARSSAPYVCPY